MSSYDASNARKYPFGLSLNQFASKKIADAIAQLGGQLPCTVVGVQGQIVNVSFDVNAAPFTLPRVSMPIATWVYDWIPVQFGDQGMTVTADVYMGGVSGLGGGAPNLSRPGNLTALVFVPVSNATWLPPANQDPNVRVVQGPNGVQIQDLAGKCLVNVNPKTGVSVFTNNLPISVNDGKTQYRSDGTGFSTLSGQSVTIKMTSQVNVLAPDILLAQDLSTIALPLKRSDGSNTNNVLAT